MRLSLHCKQADEYGLGALKRGFSPSYKKEGVEEGTCSLLEKKKSPLHGRGGRGRGILSKTYPNCPLDINDIIGQKHRTHVLDVRSVPEGIERMETPEVPETQDIQDMVDGMEGISISRFLRENGGKK